MTDFNRISRKAFAQTGAAALGALAVTGRVDAAGVTAIEITVTHYPAQDYALPVVIAQQLGYMAKEGIDVKSITGSEGGGTTVRNITQGGLIMGQVATPAAIKAILAGEELRVIAAGCQTPGTISWVTKKDNTTIKSIKDLPGKTVGFTNPGSASEALLKMSLAAAKVDASTVKMKAAGGIGENLTLLNTGGLDVAFTVDPVLTQHAAEQRVVFFARDFVPNFMQTCWVAGTEAMKTKTSLMAGFIRAWTKGVDYIVSHPIDAANRYAKVTNADPSLIAVTVSHERPGSYFGRGDFTAKSMAIVAESMRLGNLIGAEKISLAKIVDQSALPPSMRSNMAVSV